MQKTTDYIFHGIDLPYMKRQTKLKHHSCGSFNYSDEGNPFPSVPQVFLATVQFTNYAIIGGFVVISV